MRYVLVGSGGTFEMWLLYVRASSLAQQEILHNRGVDVYALQSGYTVSSIYWNMDK